MADVTRWLWTSSGTIGGPQRSVESSRIAAARARDFDFRAGTLNHGLSQRDSLMILANSLLPMPYGGSFVEPSAYARMQRRFAALERAASLYPNDGEVLAALGTGRLVITRVGSDVPQTLAVFEQAIHADSTFGPGYPAAVRLSLAAGNRDSALAYGRRYLRINPGDLSVALPVAVLEGDGSDRALRQALQRFPKANAGDAAFFLAHWPDSNETALRLFRVLEAGPTASSVFFGSALRFRGHIQEALRVDDGAYRHSPGAASELLFLSHYSQVEASALDSLSQQWVQHDIPETFPTVILREADRRDTAALSRMVQLARRREEATRDSTESLQWRYLGGLANAARALVIRDSASAEAGFLALQDSLAWESSTAPVVTTAARLLNARGHAKDALSLLQRHPPSRLGLSAWQVAWYIEVARAYMNSGDLAAARRALRPADAIWYHADSVLVTEKAALTADLRRRVGPL